MRFTLRQLEVFLAVARTQNISRAAEALAMSQSAVSGALSDLEQHFDVRLLDRIGKRLQLNELGSVLRPQVEALLEHAREVERALLRHADIGRLQIGATLTIGNYLAVGLMARFMKEQPGATATLDVANTAEIIAKVANFELDLGLIEGELRHPDLEIEPWREDELVVFCAPDHPLAGKAALTDEDLRAATWILRESGSGTRQCFERGMQGLLPELNVLLELQHTEAIKRAVETGFGIGCVSRVALSQAFERGSLVPLPVPHRSFRRRFYVVVHKQKYRSPGMLRWLALCRETAEGEMAAKQ